MLVRNYPTASLCLLFFVFLLASCGPNRQVSLAEKLMAERLTDSAIAVMESIEDPLRLSDRDYALYALLRAEASHRKGELTASTDTLLLPAINYFTRSGDSAYAERALYCKGHLERRLYRMEASIQSFLRALLFLQDRQDYEQLYRVNTWLGVVCMNQGDYVAKVKYSKAALQAALNLGNVFYKNMALCDISTGYYFQGRQDSALYYAQKAYDAALADSVPRQLLHVYNNLGSIYAELHQPAKALEYIERSMALRPASDTEAIMSLYTTKSYLFGQMGRYDSAHYYYELAMQSTSPSVQADACRYMVGHTAPDGQQPRGLRAAFALRHPGRYHPRATSYRGVHSLAGTLPSRTALGRKPPLAYAGCPSAGRLSAAGPGFPAADMVGHHCGSALPSQPSACKASARRLHTQARRNWSRNVKPRRATGSGLPRWNERWHA